MSRIVLSSLTVAVLTSFAAYGKTASAQPNDFIQVF